MTSNFTPHHENAPSVRTEDESSLSRQSEARSAPMPLATSRRSGAGFTDKFLAALHLLKQAFGKFKFQIILLTALGFLGGLLEGLGINALIPLFSFVVKDAPRGTDLFSRAIQRLFASLDLEFNFLFLLIFMAAMFALKAAILFLAQYINAKISTNYEKQIRTTLFAETLTTTWPHLLTQKIGHLEKVLMDHVGFTANALTYLSGIILLLTGLSMYIFVALNISVVITLSTLALGGVLFLFFKPFLYKTRRVSETVSQTGKAAAHHINENMIGLKTVKALGAEAVIARRGEEYFDELRQARVKLTLYENTVSAVFQPISIIFILIVFAVSYQTPEFNFASFAVIMYLIQKMFAYVQSMQSKFHTINGYVPYLQSVISYQQAAVLYREPNDGQNLFAFEHGLEFKNVRFSYQNKKQAVLGGINFHIRRGEMVGLIGPSGAGKTTIVDLLLRLFTPTSGQILINGQDIQKIDLKSWRQNIAYVSQEIFLLNDTIENNIKFYDSAITKPQIAEAAKMANIYDFVTAQPEKWQTIVGERGVLLSAGQRQRIILARALARKPAILILDEATSALDGESEILVQKSLQDLKGKITVIAIAHRLSTVRNSDRLLVLEKGQILEQGKPEKLLKDKTSYFYKVFNILEGVRT